MTDPNDLHARFPDVIDEHGQPACGHWFPGLGPCLCGNPNGHPGDTERED